MKRESAIAPAVALVAIAAILVCRSVFASPADQYEDFLLEQVKTATYENVQDFKRMSALKKLIAKKAETGLLDDPGGWFGNQLTIDDAVREHNAIVERYNSRERFIESSLETIKALRSLRTTR